MDHLRPGRLMAPVICLLTLLMVLPAARALGYTAQERSTIRSFERVAPSVVNITTMQCDPEFFWCAVPATEGAGSGVILKADGLIVTNNHVVAGARNITVTLLDGTRLEGRVVASSAEDDFAVLRIDPGEKQLAAIPLGNSDKIQVGERVLAIGNPFGLGQTLTVGTVSMTGRTIKDGGKILRNVIQTDAAINPGNSGGALVNSDGELVGICTAILSPTGSSIRIGFAIPVNRMKEVVPGLMRRWPRVVGWTVAILLVIWFIRRIYSRPPPASGPPPGIRYSN